MRDNEHPFFRPLWRRILVVAICLGWSILEFWSNAPTWGYIALAFAAYAPGSSSSTTSRSKSRRPASARSRQCRIFW